MKIVHVCTTAPWSEIYAYQENLLPHYHRLMGHEVTVLAPIYSLVEYDKKGWQPIGKSLLKDGSKLVRLPPLICNTTADRHLHLVKGLKEAILSEKPDLLFVHDICSLNYLCLKSVKITLPGVKIVMDNHSDLVNSLHSPLTRFLHKVIYRHVLIPNLLSSVERFYGVTPSRCDFIRDIYGLPESKIKLLVMGADDNDMHLSDKRQIREEVRKQYGVKSDEFLIVTGGKIDPLKNIHVLAEAVSRINDERVKMLIFGSIRDDLKETFTGLESERVICIGWQPANQVYRYFYAADLVVFPGLHSVLWEQAVASQVPCAFSKINGFEHIDIGGNCILMEGKDLDYYKNMIEDLCGDKQKYNRMLEAANSLETSKFRYSNIAQQVIDDVS